MTAEDEARRARQRVNSANYRARQRLAAADKVPRGVAPHGAGMVQKAVSDAQNIRIKRSEILSKLPNVRGIDENTPADKAARIRPPMAMPVAEGPKVKSRKAQNRRAEAIRERVAAERLQAVGKRRKADLRIELTDGPISEQLQEMTPRDRATFADYTDRIARISAQALAILFQYSGGQSVYSAAIERILYSKTRQSGFDLLASLVEYAERAEAEYSPAAMRRAGLGDKSGRLNI